MSTQREAAFAPPAADSFAGVRSAQPSHGGLLALGLLHLEQHLLVAGLEALVGPRRGVLSSADADGAEERHMRNELVRVGAELVGLRVDELRERLEVGMRQLPRLQQLRLVHEVRCLLGRRRTKLLELLDEDAVQVGHAGAGELEANDHGVAGLLELGR